MIPLNSFHHPYSRTQLALVALAFTVILAALAFSSRDVSSQGSDQQRDLDRVFSRHERLTLDPGQIQKQVKQTRSLTLNTSRGTFEMTLEPHDMRAPGYVAEAWGDKGVTVLERAPVRTYKGTVRGLPGAQARLTIDEGTVEGLIVTPSELFFLEPSKRFSESAPKTDFVFYAGSDVKEPAGECGLTMSQIVDQHAMSAANQTSKTGPKPDALFGPAMKIGIALEADFEYFSQVGSEAATVNQIVSIMSQVEALMYNPQIGLQFQLLNTRVWTMANDPYTTSDPELLLVQFTNAYNTSAPAQAAGRDLAHLFTGRDLDGNTIGIAWLPGLDCPFNPQGEGYGLSQNISNDRSVLTAHEIGHNLGAVHVNAGHGSDCTNSVMRPSLIASTNFCEFSRGQITNHAIANQNCLTESQPCSYAISPSSLPFTTAGGNGSITVTPSNAGCSWAVAEGELWLTVTSGSSGTGNGTINYSVPANNVCGSRTAQVNIAGQIHTVQQAGNPNYLIDPSTATAISAGQTLNGDLSIADCPYGTGERARAFMDRYKFNGMVGENIRIEMNATLPLASGGIDTFIYLIAPDGSIIAQSDDIWLPPEGDQTNSRIPCVNVPTGPCAVEFFTLPQTGTYTIVATSFSNGEAGAYSLTLTPLSLFTLQGGGNVAAALNSVTFTRTSNPENTAFRISDPFNFSADQTTRLILFTTDLGLPQQQNPDPGVLSVRAGGRPLVVEYVGPIAFPGLNGSYVIVSLGQLKTPPISGNLEFKVIHRGKESNGPSITIVP